MASPKSSDFVLGLDFGGTKIALATADTTGTVLRQELLPTQAEHGAVQAVSRAIEAGRRLAAETAGGQGGRLIGVGVSSMGTTLEDRVLMAPNVPGWESLTLPSAIREGFGTDVVRIDNDVRAAAAAEVRWGALAGVDSGIYLNAGTGLMAGLVVGGRVVQGAHGAAGEIGYSLRHLHETVGAGTGHAPLEEFVGGGAIAARARERFGENYTPQELFTAARTQPDARSFVEEVTTEIAYHLTNLAIALDPERIAVGGGLMRSADLLLPRLADYLHRFVPFPPEIVPARFILDAGVMGAIALGLEAAESSPPTASMGG